MQAHKHTTKNNLLSENIDLSPSNYIPIYIYIYIVKWSNKHTLLFTFELTNILPLCVALEYEIAIKQQPHMPN